MSFEEQQDFARQVADLNKYGHALNRCETVDEVVSMTLEAMSLLFGVTYSTFVEVRQRDHRVVNSTHPDYSPGDAPSEIADRACETGETITVDDESDDVTGTLAVPAAMGDDVVAVLVMRTTSGTFTEAHIRPLEILASHAATAISNIRSRERLERARRDLETRKEMIELYDRLLRHDLGNDLQVIDGFASALSTSLDGQNAEYAGKIQRAARSSADLIDQIGDIVSTLEEQEEPEPRHLGTIVEGVVEDAETGYESLTVEYEPEAFDVHVYGGELLTSVFSNILSNAAVHNDGPVTVWLTTEQEPPDHLVVVVADDGSGIHESVRDEIFEMGRKGPDSDGTGLGLGFVRALIESYGGTVAVGDSDHGGAAVRVRLELA